MTWGRLILWLLVTLGLTGPVGGVAARDVIVVGSKKFNEGYILAEIIAQLLEDRGERVDRKFGLGGTLVCYEALRGGQIDVYPEYSGTVQEAILKSARPLTYHELQDTLQETLNLELLSPFGFNNTYAIALKRAKAEELGVEKISDLTNLQNLRFGFSHEFLNRKDGWPGLAEAYGLRVAPVGIEHGLAYKTINEGKIDVTDVYSTDGDIEKYGLTLLADDRGYFPLYLAAPFVRGDLSLRARGVLGELGGLLSETKMRSLNAEVLLEGKSFADVATGFLDRANLLRDSKDRRAEPVWRRILRRTGTHLKLTFIALIAAMVVAIPGGVAVYNIGRLARPTIYGAGILQTIPSIALLALMIPLFGIGALPAVIALFLYALLPILRNTASALFSIDPVLKKVAVGIGLTKRQRLRFVEVPLAAPLILAGVRTAAVINIGTATLAAFIGAGGLGEPIVTGLALNDTSLILEGAIPAATLAILTELFFEGVERLLVPRHLLGRSFE
ncbi:MAG: ABC transporter permease subunit [Candidatus Latescibacterota bacterium]|nr:MAG: ABC transporter permease subunit [Candidatus Latescibacterota bacterium]